MKMNRGKCECDSGCQSQNSTYQKKLFYCEIQINEKNRILLEFSESIKNSTLVDKSVFKINSKIYKTIIIERNNKAFILIPDPPIKNKRKINFRIEFYNDEFYSNLNSTLANSSFVGYFYAENSTIDFENSKLKQVVQPSIIVAASISIASNPTALWSLLNSIQLLSFMPLNSINYPKDLKEISNGFINYNMIPNLFEQNLDPNSTKLPYKQAFELEILTSVVLINMGKNVMILGFMLIIIVTIGTSVIVFPRNDNIKKLFNKIKFNLVLSFFMQLFLEGGIYSAIQIKVVNGS